MGWALIAGVIFLLVCLAAARRPGRLFHLSFNRGTSTDNERLLDTSEALRATDCDRVRRLTEEDRYGFLQVWRSVRQRFTTDPRVAVTYADLLISDLIQDCTRETFPAEARPGALLDCQLQYKYVAAHQIALHDRRERIEPGELARAMNLYAAVFDELLAAPSQDHRRN